MRYWDSSALAPLLVGEPSSAAMARLLLGDPVIVTWWGTRVECVSVLTRMERGGLLDDASHHGAQTRLGRLASEWAEVAPGEPVREQAERVLRVHPLRAADAFQLAAALVASDLRPSTLPFVSLDQRLVTAARREGFPPLPPL